MPTIDRADLLVIAFLDPAGSKKLNLKKVRANSAIEVIGVDDLERVFVLYDWAGREKTEQIIERLFMINDTYHPRQFGIEANAMQSLFADAVEYVAKMRTKRIPIVPIQQNTRIDKDFRVRSVMQPIIANGRLFLQEKMLELKAEIQSFPTGQTKDRIDALASACAMIPSRTLRRQEESEEENLREYLLETGMDPRLVESQLSE